MVYLSAKFVGKAKDFKITKLKKKPPSKTR